MANQHATHEAEIAATHVYVMQDDLGRVKIGISRKPKGRMNDLQKASASSVSLVSSQLAEGRGAALAVERRAHALLQPLRIRGEWFSVPPEAAALLVGRLCAGCDDDAALIAEKVVAERAYDALPEAAGKYLDDPEGPEYIAARERSAAASRTLISRGLSTSSWDDVF